jgi:hypothetical protein
MNCVYYLIPEGIMDEICYESQCSTCTAKSVVARLIT